MSKNIITLDQLEASKRYVKSGVTYETPAYFLEPMLNMVNKWRGSDYIIKYEDAVVNAEEDKSENISYGRFAIDAKVANGEFNKRIGIVVALNINAPIIGAYSGTEVSACTNLCVFNYEHMSTFLLNSKDYKKVYDNLDSYFNNIDAIYTEYLEVIDRMKNKVLNTQQINEFMGELLFYGSNHQQLGTTPVLSAVKALSDEQSIYSIREGQTTLYNIYNSITQNITDKAGILDKSSKTLSLIEPFKLN